MHTQQRPLYFLIFQIFFLFGSSSIFSMYLPIYLQEIGLDKGSIGLFTAVGPIISLFSGPFWGYWIEVLQDVHRVLKWLMVGNAIFVLFLFYAQHSVTVFITLVVLFFFQSALLMHMNTLILYAIEGRNTNYGVYRSWGSIGWAVSALALGPLVGFFGMSSTGLVCATLIALSYICNTWMQKRNKKTEISYTTARMNPETPGRLKNILKPQFVFFVIICMVVAIPNAMNSTFLSLYIYEMNGNSHHINLAVFLSAITEVPLFILLDRYFIPEKTRMIRWLLYACLLYALRWFLMLQLSNPWLLATVQMFNGITFGIFLYVGTKMVEMMVSSQFRATGQSVLSIALSGVSGVIASLAGGFLYKNFGALILYRFGTIAGLVGATSFMIMWFWVKKIESPR